MASVTWFFPFCRLGGCQRSVLIVQRGRRGGRGCSTGRSTNQLGGKFNNNKSITYYVISINDEKLDLQLNRFKQNVASCFHVRTEVMNDKNDDQSLLVLYPALQAHTPADGGHPAHDKVVLFFSSNIVNHWSGSCPLLILSDLYFVFKNCLEQNIFVETIYWYSDTKHRDFIASF